MLLARGHVSEAFGSVKVPWLIVGILPPCGIAFRLGDAGRGASRDDDHCCALPPAVGSRAVACSISSVLEVSSDDCDLVTGVSLFNLPSCHDLDLTEPAVEDLQ